MRDYPDLKENRAALGNALHNLGFLLRPKW